ncbi:MAG: HlyU family transcriptional regulator [Pseudomonadota bacterium]
MSFFKKLFGLGGNDQAGASGEWEPAGDAVEHEGYTIIAKPMKEGGQYRLAGTISKDVGGEVKEHQFVRADLFSSKDDAVQFTIVKAKQVIREQGERMFG